MDTHGHHLVLQQGAEPRLRRAFAEKQVEGWNTNALYLGNWLADLSQLNDPGSTLIPQLSHDLADIRSRRSAIAAQITTKAAAALATVSAGAGLADDRADVALLPRLGAMIRTRVEDALEAVFTMLAATASSGNQIGATLISLTRVLGFLKFARPESNRERLSIPFDTYETIFAELCRQYFPHEHMDRPLCSASYGPPCEIEWGAQYQHLRGRLYASRRAKAGSDSHMYTYLVDDRTIIAGRLAELDLGWASRDLPAGPPSENPVSPEDRDLALARLGHTLHAVEDFFAHSTFVEHAVFNAAGPDGMNDVLFRRSARRVGDTGGTDVAAAKVLRRLQRYNPDLYEPNAPDGEREDALATGYFDGWDTINSILHFVEELIRPELLRLERRQRLGPAGEAIWAALATYADETVGDILEMLQLVVPEDADSWNVKVHQAIDGLVEYLQLAAQNGETVSVETVAGKASQDLVLRTLPAELVRDALGPAVLGLIAVVKGAKTGWTIYKAAKAAAEFRQNPVAYLLKPLTDDRYKSIAKLGLNLLVELGKDPLVDLNYVLLSELQQMFRANRVGCHSLLAKDQPTEPLFDEMFRCARHVDWFIVDTLCRWSDPAWTTNTRENRKWVRWDELLANYMRAPVDIPLGPRRRVHWRRVRDLKRQELTHGETLRTAYQRMVANVGSGLEVAGYEDFLAANLGLASGAELLRPSPVAGMTLDEDKIVDLLVASGLALRTPTAYELLPGVELAIPVYRTVPIDIVEKTAWFSDVLHLRPEAWETAAHAYEVTRWTDAPEFTHHQLTYVPGSSREEIQREVRRLIDYAAHIRKELEREYGQQGQPKVVE